jgi:hypothetical protein
MGSRGDDGDVMWWGGREVRKSGVRLSSAQWTRADFTSPNIERKFPLLTGM